MLFDEKENIKAGKYTPHLSSGEGKQEIEGVDVPFGPTGNVQLSLFAMEVNEAILDAKARNLLEWLTNFELETLRFMDDPLIPFTNNRGENDIRMTKVQKKISGCFRSMEGAMMFCRIRGYIYMHEE